MAKRYKHLKIEEVAHKELKKMKNLYELQDNKEYSISGIILRLIDDRTSKQFKLPLDSKK